MFAYLGSICTRRWSAVAAAWVVAAVALWAVAPSWSSVARDGDLDYLPATMPSARGAALLAAAFPQQVAKSQIVVVIERDGLLGAEGKSLSTAVGKALGQLREQLPIADVWTQSTPQLGKLLISPKTERGQASLVVAQLDTDFMAVRNVEVLETVRGAVAEVADREHAADAGLRWGITGSAAIGGDILSSANETVRNTDWMTATAVLVVLLFVYRAPLLALVPLVTIAFSVTVSTSLLALLTQVDQLPGFSWWNFRVFTTTRVFLVVVLFGCGTDFCLFLIARYREEFAGGRARDSSLIRALGHVGEALCGSAMTTIVGLGCMAFADFGKFRNSGPAIAIALTVTLLACLTLAPAMLSALGPWLFWPRSMQAVVQQANDMTGGVGRFAALWDWIARVTIRRPALVLALAVAAMAPLAAVAVTRTAPTYDLIEELKPSRISVVGTRMLQRHFAAGESTPLGILVHQPGGALNTTEAKYGKLVDLTAKVGEMPGVENVRSLPRPLGKIPVYTRGLKGSDSDESPLARVRRQYLSQAEGYDGEVTRLDVVLKYSPFTPEAAATLTEIESRLAALASDASSPWHGAEFYYTGTVAGIRDLRTVTQSDEHRIEILAGAGVLCVLLVLLRRPVVCAYLITTVLFSFLVALGATEWVFRERYGDSFVGLDWKVSLYLFVLLVAIGQDYNVYLVTRVFEEQRRRGPVEGLRFAVVRTGGIITSCGVIMAVTFVSLLTGSLRFMVELGFALSFGVMLDTCIVRPILVPAFLALQMRLAMRDRRA